MQLRIHGVSFFRAIQNAPSNAVVLFNFYRLVFFCLHFLYLLADFCRAYSSLKGIVKGPYCGPDFGGKPWPPTRPCSITGYSAKRVTPQRSTSKIPKLIFFQ